jgi:hypothetical protein
VAGAGAEAPAAPAAAAAAAGAPPSPTRSRRAGAALLAAIVVVVAVAIALIVGSGGSAKHSAGESASGSSAAGATGSSTSAGSSTTQTGKAKEDKRITLTSPDPSSNAAGVAEVLSEGSQYAFYLAAEHLPPSKGRGFFYAVWLYNSPSSFQALSRAPAVGPSGSVQGGALLPKDAGKYHTMLLTHETAARPTRPGPVVLRGAFALH